MDEWGRGTVGGLLPPSTPAAASAEANMRLPRLLLLPCAQRACRAARAVARQAAAAPADPSLHLLRSPHFTCSLGVQHFVPWVPEQRLLQALLVQRMACRGRERPKRTEEATRLAERHPSRVRGGWQRKGRRGGTCPAEALLSPVLQQPVSNSSSPMRPMERASTKRPLR